MGVDSLQKFSHIVILDLRKWLGRNATENENINSDKITVIPVDNLSDLQQNLQLDQALVAIDFLGATEISNFVRRELDKFNIPVVLVERGAIPKPLLKARLSLMLRQVSDSDYHPYLSRLKICPHHDYD